MTKLLLFCAFLCLLTVALGTAFLANNPLFWIASGGPLYQSVRCGLMFVMFWQLVTHPPRKLVFRIIASVIALCAGAFALVATYTANMEILDTLSLMGAAAAIGVTALEIQQPRSLHNPPAHGHSAF